MPAVSNTSPISNLAWIVRLDLLHEQFREVWIPKAVETELRQIPDPAAIKTIDAALAAGWLKSRAATDAALVNLLMVELHAGESEAIALALDVKADRLLIDEREGRTRARQLGLPVTGVLGVLLRAKRDRRINAVKPEIEALKSKARFFVAHALEHEILRAAGE
jgi:predicted nucleic acid-binding protein